MTLDDFAAEMAFEFGEQYSDPDISTQFQRWSLEAFTHVYAATRWIFQNLTDLLTVSDGVSVYSLAPNVAEVKNVVDPLTGAEIPYVPVERLIARRNKLSDTAAVASAWFYEGAGDSGEYRIHFYPVPNVEKDYDLHLLTRAPSLSASSAIPLSVDYLPAMREYVRRLMYINDGNLPAAQDSAQMFAAMMNNLLSRFGPAPSAPSRLKVKRARQVNQGSQTA